VPFFQDRCHDRCHAAGTGAGTGAGGGRGRGQEAGAGGRRRELEAGGGSWRQEAGAGGGRREQEAGGIRLVLFSAKLKKGFDFSCKIGYKVRPVLWKDEVTDNAYPQFCDTRD
jgi:hypothetical protein